ncbi:MAG: adenylate kinase [Candidatus Bathyarchaeota archaeon]|nr:MAG: adenylate kinase [Candidatus Bathyarchaeota archaeon]
MNAIEIVITLPFFPQSETRGDSWTRIIILGPPGSGKGTRAKIMGKLYDLPVVTTGDMLREAVSEGTELGKLAEGYMNRGELVRDDIVISIVEDRMSKPDVVKGFILDGFPRSVEQAEALDRILNRLGTALDVVLYITAEQETIIERLSLRRSCPKCGAIYHLKDMLPEREGICDECGGVLVQREDDKAKIIRHRLEVYEKQTFPILERYERVGKVRQMSGEIDIKEIPDEIRRVLGPP